MLKFIFRLPLAFLLCCIFSFTYAQFSPPDNTSSGIVSGRVTDPLTQTGIEYASVALYRLRDSIAVAGMTTDSTGNFRITGLSFGKYRMKISFIGYKNYINDSVLIHPKRPEYLIPTVELESTEVTTQTVEIEGVKGTVQIGPEKKVFNTDKMTIAQGGTAQDILEQLPSVTVDQDGKASMRGSGSVMILIDGKPSNLTGGSRSAVLEQIPANIIERVEVITNPSARYDPDGMSGIINIILKKNRKPGYFGSVNGNIGTNHKYNGGFSLSVGNSIWNLSTSYTYRYVNNFLRGISERKNSLPDTTFFFDQKNTGWVVNESHVGNISVDYRPKEGHSLTLSAAGNYRDKPKYELADYVFMNSNRIKTLSSERPFSNFRIGNGYDVGFNYIRNFKMPEHKLNILFNYSRYNDDERLSAEQSFVNTDGRPDSIPIRQKNRNLINGSVVTFQLDYIRPLKNKQRYELGGKNISRTTDQDFKAEDFDFNLENWNNNSGLTNRFIFTESVYALYGIYAGEYKKWEYQAGLRLEQAFTYSEQKTSNLNYRYNYFSFFPSFHGAYKFNEFRQIQFNYSRRINRPEMESLNPFLNYGDPLNVQLGNPQLKPEYINSFELQYVQFTKKITLTGTVYYRYQTDQIIRFRYLEPTGVAVMTYRNLGDNQSYGAEAIFVTRFLKWWNTTSSLNVYGIRLNDPRLVNNAQVTGYAWIGKIISNFILPKKIELQLAYNYRSGFPIAQGEMKPMHGMDIALKIPVFKEKGNILINVSDIFDTRQFEILSQGPGFRQEFIRKRETRIAFLGFNYSFGNLKATAKPKKRSGRSEGEDGGDMGM